MERIVQLLKALADETRLKILIILSKRSICAKGISKHLDISEAAVSQHIKLLKEAGIIIGEKQGYYVQYNLQKPILQEIIMFLDEVKDDRGLNMCNINLQMPNECKAHCNSNKKKCCQRYNN